MRFLEIAGSCEFDPDYVKTVYEMYKPDDGVIWLFTGSEGHLVGGRALLRLIRTISMS